LWTESGDDIFVLYSKYQGVGNGHCWKLKGKSRHLIKVPPLTAVYDVSGVAALNSISSNPILLTTCWVIEHVKGGSLTALSLQQIPSPVPTVFLGCFLLMKLTCEEGMGYICVFYLMYSQHLFV
jgi:hypothetical protein